MCTAFVAPSFSVALAATDENTEKNSFRYDIYKSGGYYEVNYLLKINKDTADAINAKYDDESLAGKTGVNKFFDSIEQFFYAYENLFFNKAHGRKMRHNEVTKYSASTYPYYAFNMYIYFSGDKEKSAGEKYWEYLGFKASSGDIKPDKKNFFAEYYDSLEEGTHFAVPEMTGGFPEPKDFKSDIFAYDSLRRLASYNAIMMPFLLYGNVNNTGFGDEENKDKKINYKGLVNEFPLYFENRDVGSRAKLFAGYDLLHTMSFSTAYVRTNGKKTSGGGEHTHEWQVSYTDGNFDPNRDLIVTQIIPKVINWYLLAIIIAFVFIGIMALCFLLPKEKAKKS